jgi:hypothetical protein
MGPDLLGAFRRKLPPDAHPGPLGRSVLLTLQRAEGRDGPHRLAGDIRDGLEVPVVVEDGKGGELRCRSDQEIRQLDLPMMERASGGQAGRRPRWRDPTRARRWERPRGRRGAPGAQRTHPGPERSTGAPPEPSRRGRSRRPQPERRRRCGVRDSSRDWSRRSCRRARFRIATARAMRGWRGVHRACLPGAPRTTAGPARRGAPAG